MSDTPRHSVSVAAAIFDHSGENVLLIKRRDNGRWEPPGGVLELDETIDNGLRREVREETGAEIEVGPLTGVYKNMSRGIVALVFRCALVTDPMSHSDEATVVEWSPVAQVPIRMEEAYAIRILDAQFGASAAVRVHDGQFLLRDAHPTEHSATEVSTRGDNDVSAEPRNG